jgi:hypothetical protein
MEKQKRSPEIEFLPFDFENQKLVEEAINLLNEGTSAKRHNMDFWNWRFKENPFGKSLGWYAMDNLNKKLAGILLWWPWKFTVNGNEVLFYQAINGKTSNECRNLGVFRTLNDLSLKYFQSQNIGLYGFPNENSYPSYHEPVWKTVTKVQPWLVPVSFRTSLFNLLINKKPDLQTVSGFKNLTTDILNEISTSASILMTAWNSISIQWRFESHPLHVYKFFNFQNQFIIYRIKKRFRFFEAQIVFSDIADDSILPVFMKHLKCNGIDFMTYFGHNTTLSKILKRRMIKFKLKKNLHFVIHNATETEVSQIRFEMAEADSQ